MEVGLDWRDFRAKLVEQETREQVGEAGGEEAAAASGGEAVAAAAAPKAEGWAHATPIIEQGSLLLSAPGDHFAINQQYFHKTLIFIVEHSDTFTRGVILNRPTAFRTGDLRLDLVGNVTSVHSDAWNVWCGGDCEGLNSRGSIGESVVYFCLHTLDRLKNVSHQIIKGVFTIELAEAQQLVAAGEADKDDFLLLAGYCGWGAGQLQGELDRGGTWTLAAADKRSLLGRLRDAQASLTQRLEAATGTAAQQDPAAAIEGPRLGAKDVGDGTPEWRDLYAALGPAFAAEMQNDTETHTDEMLRRWIDRCLIPARLKGNESSGGIECDASSLPAGTLVRGSPTAWLLGKPAEDALLDPSTVNGVPGQYLHKAVMLLVRDYELGNPALLVLLNGPEVGRVQEDDGVVYFGGPTTAGSGVFEVRGPTPYRFQGMVLLAAGSLESLLSIGALEVASGVDLQDVLAAPRGQRWEAAGGRIDRLSEAAESQLGDAQQQIWYKRFLDVDLFETE